MSLDKYREKRDFEKTTEPKGKSPKGRREGLRFVIHKHDASRLHYDLRLELEGVLKSWAVPKGPSLDPSDKRLAVHVEDHPLEYGDFEGVIPEGEYGAGSVMLWDDGTWEPEEDPVEGYEKGTLKFSLRGHKLKGSWTLTRMKTRDKADNWLLIKHKDDQADPERDITEAAESVATGRSMEEIAEGGESAQEGDPPPSLEDAPGAKKAKFPDVFKPQLAKLVGEAPGGEDWLHEIKYDGYRFLAFIQGGKVTLRTRNGKDWTDRFEKIARYVEKLPVEEAVLDGEVVAQLPDGRTDFQTLQNRMKGRTGEGTLLYYVFDMPYCEGYDLHKTPLKTRKELLKSKIEGGNDVVRYSDHIEGRGHEFHDQACKKKLEGIISKRADSTYVSKRSSSWVKVKCVNREEVVIGGFTAPSGSRVGFGSLLVGYYDSDGKLVYAGGVGTGYSDDTLRALHDEMMGLERKTPPFGKALPRSKVKNATWVTPKLVAEVEFTEWTDEGQMRHPVFKGLREDKPAEEVTLGDRAKNEESSNAKPSKGKKGRMEVEGVVISSPDKKLYPDTSHTKADLVEYYQKIADRLLPHIENRPLSMVRCPDGWKGDCFFHKHFKESMPKQVKRVEIEEKKGKNPYVYVDDIAGVIALAQLGSLELHSWGCRVDKIEKPDIMLFDLDPDEGVPWKDIVEGARILRDLLDDLGLESFLKTSGGKGLHVVVPLTRRAEWDEVKDFSHAVATSMKNEDPRRFIDTMSKQKRKGKIFVDYLRNGRGATAIVPFSTRARKGAPVSVPISWDELEEDLRADRYNIDNIFDHLDALKKDPWEGFFDVRQQITKEMKKKMGM